MNMGLNSSEQSMDLIITLVILLHFGDCFEMPMLDQLIKEAPVKEVLVINDNILESPVLDLKDLVWFGSKCWTGTLEWISLSQRNSTMFLSFWYRKIQMISKKSWVVFHNGVCQTIYGLSLEKMQTLRKRLTFCSKTMPIRGSSICKLNFIS